MNRFKPPEFAGRLHPRNLSADFLDFFRQGMTRLSLDHLSHRIKWHVRSKILDQLVKQLLVGGGRLKRIHVTKLIRQRVIFFGQIRSDVRSEEHTSELPSLMRNSYAVFCLKKKTQNN